MIVWAVFSQFSYKDSAVQIGADLLDVQRSPRARWLHSLDDDIMVHVSIDPVSNESIERLLSVDYAATSARATTTRGTWAHTPHHPSVRRLARFSKLLGVILRVILLFPWTTSSLPLSQHRLESSFEFCIGHIRVISRCRTRLNARLAPIAANSLRIHSSQRISGRSM
jgi:hypothetical protein